MSVSIEKATPGDIPLILSLIHKLAEYERAPDEVKATDELLREALFGARPHAEAVIARADGEAAGFALFFHNFSTWLARPGIYLEDLFVLPEQRGKGIGRALLEYLARVAVERGCGRMEWSVLDWNEPAIGFYRKLGAVPKDEWTTFRLTGENLRSLAGEVAVE